MSSASARLPTQRRTNPQRFILGMLAATGTGAGLVSLPFALMPPFILFGIIAFPFAAFGFAAGVILLGMPAWLAMNRLGVRSRGAALALGAALTSSFVVAWSVATRQVGVAPSVAAAQSLWVAAGLGLAGAAAALVGWGVAYRPDVRRAEAEIDEVFG